MRWRRRVKGVAERRTDKPLPLHLSTRQASASPRLSIVSGQALDATRARVQSPRPEPVDSLPLVASIGV